MTEQRRRVGFQGALAIDVLLAVLAIVLVLSTAPLAARPLPSFFFDRSAAALLVLLASATAWLIDRRHPGHTVARILAWFGFWAGLEAAALLYSYRGLGLAGHSLPGANLAGLLQPMIIAPGFAVAFVFLPLLFPDGRLPSPRWRPVIWLTVAAAVAAEVGLLLIDAFADSIWEASAWATDPWVATGWSLRLGQALYGFAFVAIIFTMTLSGLSLVVRYRRSDLDTRQQIKWFVYLGIPAVLINAMIVAHVPSPSFDLGVLGPVSGLAAVAGIGIAILRHRLYDIDVVISKTIVYGSLAVMIGAVYVAVVAGVGRLADAEGPNLGLTLAATVVVAIAFDPARRRLERLANRLVFGARATPYEVLTQLSQRLSDALTPAETLPRIAETVARAVGGVAGRVTLRLPENQTVSASWPSAADGGAREEVVPVVRHGEVLGEVAIIPAPGEFLRPADRALLARLAEQSGVALANLRLAAQLEARLEELNHQAADLAASGRRLVTARDTERRRLSEEIERRIGPSLDAVERGLRRVTVESADGAETASELERLRGVTTEALDELRAMARGVYPPLLADKGLVAALEAEVRKLNLSVSINARLDEAIKGPFASTAYFCCREILSAAENSGSARAAVDLTSSDGRLDVAMEEDGPGPAWDDASMRLAVDRAAAAGASSASTGRTGWRWCRSAFRWILRRPSRSPRSRPWRANPAKSPTWGCRRRLHTHRHGGRTPPSHRWREAGSPPAVTPRGCGGWPPARRSRAG